MAISLLASTISRAQTTTGPDLTVTRSTNTAVYTSAYTLVSLTVTNLGNAPAPSVDFTYTPAQPKLQSPTSTYGIAEWLKGHSGRGGGYTQVGWICTELTPVPLAPGASTVVQFYVVYPTGTFNEVWTVNAGTAAQLNLVSHVSTTTVVSTLPPVPSAPRSVVVSESGTGDSLIVSWRTAAVAGAAITGSTVTATPTAGIGTTVLYGSAAGQGTYATVVGVEPSTTYSVTVQSSDAGGAGAVSAPVIFTTPVAHTPPKAPTNVHAFWAGTTELSIGWTASVPGDSPIDDYEVSVTGTDGSKSVTQTGTLTQALVPADSTQDSVTIDVRAHNAAGWGYWSPAFVQPGL